MAFEAVVFDFDGVLACTMEDNFRAWHRTLRPHIPDLDREEYLLLEGLPPQAVAAALLGARGLSLAPAAELAARKEEAYLQDHRFALYPGMPELLERLAARLPLGLVTGSGLARLERTLGPAALARFRAVVCAADRIPPKPSPEPYLAAAARLGVAPSRCLVAENAPLGIRSAKAAGMTVVAVASTLAPERLAEADLVVADSLALAERIEGLLGDRP